MLAIAYRSLVIFAILNNFEYNTYLLGFFPIFYIIQIDGDTDSPTVQREFEKCIRNFVDKVNSNSLVSNKISSVAAPLLKASNQTDAILQDLESNTAGVVPTISHQVSRLNDHNTKKEALNRQMNGDIATDRNMDFRHMLEEAERYPVDSYM